jgi:hypothetical protein
LKIDSYQPKDRLNMLEKEFLQEAENSRIGYFRYTSTQK